MGEVPVTDTPFRDHTRACEHDYEDEHLHRRDDGYFASCPGGARLSRDDLVRWLLDCHHDGIDCPAEHVVLADGTYAARDKLMRWCQPHRCVASNNTNCVRAMLYSVQGASTDECSIGWYPRPQGQPLEVADAPRQ